MEFKTLISPKGEIVLPKAIMQALGIKEEAEVSMSVKDGNVLEIKRVEKSKEAANNSNAEIDTATLTILETTLL